jgi:glycosyltransferase involved in cell wall biosynthesis
MAESLACGTPVIAMNRGAVPEVLRNGLSGFVCRSIDEMIRAVPRIVGIDRVVCRHEAQRFAAAEMGRAYERVYVKLLNNHPKMAIARELGANADYHRAS